MRANLYPIRGEGDTTAKPVDLLWLRVYMCRKLQILACVSALRPMRHWRRSEIGSCPDCRM